MKREVVRTRNFANDATNFIVEKARAALAEYNEFRIALSGGNTPRAVYLELAKRSLPWEKALITFGDERCVPPQDEQSNFKMANETLLKPAAVPASSVLRMRGEIASNCIHAVSDLDTESGVLHVGRQRGDSASQEVVNHLTRWIIDPQQTHPWVAERIGLRGQPIKVQTAE